MRDRTRQHPWCCAAFALLACSGWGAAALAQVVVVRVDPAAEPTCEAIEASLEDWGISPDLGYFAEAQRLGMHPNSDAALERLIPPLAARLALVPRAGDDSEATIDFRDGATGASLGAIEVPLVNGKFERTGARTLRKAVAEQIGPPPTAAGSESAPESESDGLAPHGEATSEGVGVIVRVSGGAGFGARTLEWPASGETLAVETGLFAAVDLGASFAVALGSSVSLGLEFSYQTSVAAEVEETHIAGASDSLGIRAHRFDAVFAAAFGGSGFRVTPALGYTVRGLRPEVHHLLTPSYSLAGPILKVGFRIPFTDSFALRAVPEAQYVIVGDELEELGVAGSGFGLGGELALEIQVSSTLALELSGKAMRAWLASPAGSDATDTGEFATARLVWQP
jgi:hypothetical protein